MQKKKVLLVEDVELVLHLQKTFCKRQDFEILTAKNGTQALEIALQDRPDLVFMDHFMPEMNGDECCRRIKEHPELQGIPVVIVTSCSKPVEVAKCREAGCDEILFKPLERHQFLATAHRFLLISTRQAPRINARLRVHFGFDPQQLLTDYTLNLSSGGLFLETDRPLEVETPLTLEFALPDRSHPVRCKGRVAWVNFPDHKRKPQMPTGMGVQFLDISLEDLHAIRDFIDKQDIAAYW